MLRYFIFNKTLEEGVLSSVILQSYITLKPYRKYQPVFEIIEETKCMGTMIPGRELEVNKFVFEETQFMTVKSIMNKKVKTII